MKVETEREAAGGPAAWLENHAAFLGRNPDRHRCAYEDEVLMNLAEEFRDLERQVKTLVDSHVRYDPGHRLYVVCSDELGLSLHATRDGAREAVRAGLGLDDAYEAV